MISMSKRQLRGCLAALVIGATLISAPFVSRALQAPPPVPEIQRLLADPSAPGAIAAAKDAAQRLLTPVAKGGYLFAHQGDIWFEATSQADPDHSLSSHLQALSTLQTLHEITGDAVYLGWLDKGVATLERWFERFDSGSGLREDLAVRPMLVWFQLSNPYGFKLPNVAIDRITLHDPVSGQSVLLDVGNAADGDERIVAGAWGEKEQVAGQRVRRLLPSHAPAAFSLQVPAAFAANQHVKPFELRVHYYDERPGNIAVQRQVEPSDVRPLPAGDLLLTGANTWREWRVAVRPVDLAPPSSAEQMRAYVQQLEALQGRYPSLKPWRDAVGSYLNVATLSVDDYRVVEPALAPAVKSTPMAPGYVLDADGVLQARLTNANAKYLPNGEFDTSVDPLGEAVYHPFVIADQLLNGDSSERKQFQTDVSRTIHRQPALDWFMDPANQFRFADATTYRYPFDSAYNDVATAAPWSSAFSQAFNIKALMYADQHMPANPAIKPLLARLANAYAYPVKQGGLASMSIRHGDFFEEVPNGSHILNGHLVSVAELAALHDYLPSPVTAALVEQGVASIHRLLPLFDTGYWLRYDLNPKKSLLFQIDWGEGQQSPLIDEVRLLDPASATATQVDVGHADDGVGDSRMAGIEWQAEALVDGRSVRDFHNGYSARELAAPGGTRHNVFLAMALPNGRATPLLDVQPHVLVIRYKDVAAGRFVIKVQAINEGNHVAFVPLHQGVWQTKGDGQWKDASFTVRPQDMGWYKGVDYQRFETDQLARIAERRNDPLLMQMVERHRYFMEAKLAGKEVIHATGD